jgi:hypothetical protein
MCQSGPLGDPPNELLTVPHRAVFMVTPGKSALRKFPGLRSYFDWAMGCAVSSCLLLVRSEAPVRLSRLGELENGVRRAHKSAKLP